MQDTVLASISIAEKNEAKGKAKDQAAVIKLMMAKKRNSVPNPTDQPENVSATGTNHDLENQTTTTTNLSVSQLEPQHLLRPCLHKVLFDL